MLSDSEEENLHFSIPFIKTVYTLHTLRGVVTGKMISLGDI